LTKAHGAQLLNYLKVARMGVGLLLNFGIPQVEIKRIINRGYFDEAVRQNG
jgi:GxxExxY protein